MLEFKGGGYNGICKAAYRNNGSSACVAGDFIVNSDTCENGGYNNYYAGSGELDIILFKSCALKNEIQYLRKKAYASSESKCFYAVF